MGKLPGDGQNIADWFDYPHEDYLEAKYGNRYMEPRYAHDVEPAIAKLEIKHLLSPIENEALKILFEPPEKRKSSFRLSDALAIYLETHRMGRDRAFITATNRAIAHVYSSLGDLPLKDFDRSSARLVRDAIAGTTGTKRRRLAVISAVINKAILEFGLKDVSNPFRSLEIHGEAEDTQTRLPFTPEELQVISKACVTKDDDLRWIIAMQADTGARLGEIVGLRRDDVCLEAPVPLCVDTASPRARPDPQDP